MHVPAILTLFLLHLISHSSCGRPVQRSIQQYPKSYNLHQEFTPQNINDLSDDTKRRAMIDVKSTIAEVQRLLQQDPALPRLTTGEIEEVFENVTRDELDKSIRYGDKSREKHMRALMLVLPYHANDLSQENLEELYTKPPITKLMQTEPRRNRPQPPPPPMRQRLPTTYRPSHKYRNIMTTKYIRRVNPTTFHPKPNFMTATQDYLMPTTFSPSDNYRREKIKERYSSQYNADKMQYYPSLKRGPMRENVKGVLATIGLFPDASETINNFDFEPEDPTTTTTMKVPVTWSTRSNYVTAAPPSHRPVPANTDIEDILKTLGLLQPPPKLQYQIIPSRLAAPLARPMVADIVDTESNLKPVMAPLVQDEPEFTSFDDFKPLPETTKTKEFKMSIAPQSQAEDYVSFKKLPQESPKALNNDFADFLKSFGLIGPPMREPKAVSPENMTTNTETSFEMLETTESESHLKEVEPQNLTKIEVLKDIPVIDMEYLTPAMAGVLGNIGMLPQKPHKMKKLNLDTFNEFDLPVPSPVYQSKPEEDYQKLQQFFVAIHELDKQNRNLTVADLEALNIHGISDSLLTKGPDPLTYNEYDVSKNEVKRQEAADFSEIDVGSSTEGSPTRVTLNFGTQETVEEEIVEETIVTKQDKNTETLEIITPTPAVELAPPVFDPIAEATSTTVPEEIATTTTTPLAISTTPSQADTAARANSLADSFPKEIGPVVEVALPPPRRNGFYFYSDWNSFLEVGEEPNKVVIRFDPKIGDPSRFLEVNIPSKNT